MPNLIEAVPSRKFDDLADEMQHREPINKLEKALRDYAWASNENALDIVIDNWSTLKDAGLVEEAFICAWSRQKYGTPHWSIRYLSFLFADLNCVALLKAGDPLPDGDSFIVYRGVAGNSAKRRVHGYSWTADQQIARRFADIRSLCFHLADPAVYSAIIQRDEVLAYIDASGRNEKEFLVLPKSRAHRVRSA